VFKEKIESTTEKRKRFNLLQLCICMVVILCLFFVSIPSSHAQTRTDEEIPNEFIFRVLLLPNWTISDAIFAYELNGKYYLPIKALSDGFEFFVDVEVQGQLAQGFASTEDNRFILDGKRGELTVSGNRDKISQDSILISDYVETDDLYVQLEILNKIWPVQMRVDLSNITIQVEAEESLSFMRKKEREEKRLKIESRSAEREKFRTLLPFRENKYDYLGKPIIDYQAIYDYSTKQDQLLASNIFTGIQQIGKTIADYSANFRLNQDGQIHKPENVRLRFSRSSYGDETLLLPTIRRFEVGDVTIRQRDLITTTRNGRGLAISNDNQNREAEFDRITIEGVGPPGWETELYNNDELIAFDSVPANGQYFFENVILNYGNNEIKILFFGPQGQVREETRSYRAGGSMLSPGQFQYNIGLLDSGRDFIFFDNNQQVEPTGLVKTGFASYGVNEKLTLFGGYTEVPQNVEDESYLSIGAATDTPIGLIEAEAYHEIDGGNALSANIITEFLGLRSNIRTAFFNNFESQEAGFGNDKKSFETEAQINKNVNILGTPIGLRLNAIHTERETSPGITSLGLTQTFAQSGIRLSHTTTTRLMDGGHDLTIGSLTTTVREGPWQLRGGLNYNAYPDLELASGNGQVRYQINDDFQIAYDLSHNFLNSDYTTGVQLGYDFKKFLGTLETDYQRNNGWMITMRATTSLNPYTQDGTYDLSSISKRNHAPMKAHIFLDKDADGLFDEDIDEPLPEIRLNVAGGRSRSRTNDEGYVIANAAPDRQVNFQIDEKSLTDPYYVPGRPGFSTNPIKGKMVEGSFPVVETGAIEGFAYRQDTERAVSGLTLHLTNPAGETVMSAVTGFDGYYAFEFVPPNTYTIAADASHNVKTMPNTASLTPQDIFIYGNDITIIVPGFERMAFNENDIDIDPLDPLMEEKIDALLSEEESEPSEKMNPDKIFGPHLEN